jgi:hypothetical protein
VELVIARVHAAQRSSLKYKVKGVKTILVHLKSDFQFVVYLFNDTFSSNLDYITSNENVISE